MVLYTALDFPFFPNMQKCFWEFKEKGLIDRIYERQGEKKTTKKQGFWSLGLHHIGWYHQRGLYKADVVIFN